MSNVSAQFPAAVWDGTTPTRNAYDVANVTAAPRGPDFDQVTAELQAIQTAILPSAWTSVGALSGSWTGTIKYKTVGKKVHLTGVGTAGTKTDATTLFTLPSGTRPTNALTISVCPDAAGTGDANMRLKIGSDGTVKVYGLSATTTIDFSGVSFQTDQ